MCPTASGQLMSLECTLMQSSGLPKRHVGWSAKADAVGDAGDHSGLGEVVVDDDSQSWQPGPGRFKWKKAWLDAVAELVQVTEEPLDACRHLASLPIDQ